MIFLLEFCVWVLLVFGRLLFFIFLVIFLFFILFLAGFFWRV